MDLRRKIVEAYDTGEGMQHVLAKRFGVSLSFVEKLLYRRRTTNSIAPTPKVNGPQPRLNEAAQALVRQHLETCNDATLAELCEAVRVHTGIIVSPPTMCRALKSLQLTRKKRQSTPVNEKQSVSRKHAQPSAKLSLESKHDD